MQAVSSLTNMESKLNVLLTCVIVYQYSETNVMHFLFNLHIKIFSPIL
jgi:hypothetical protein